MQWPAQQHGGSEILVNCGSDFLVQYCCSLSDSRLERLPCPQVTDIYSTGEPQAAFHARIAFCLDLHNEAVKAMRYEVRD